MKMSCRADESDYNEQKWSHFLLYAVSLLAKSLPGMYWSTFLWVLLNYRGVQRSAVMGKVIAYLYTYFQVKLTGKSLKFANSICHTVFIMGWYLHFFPTLFSKNSFSPPQGFITVFTGSFVYPSYVTITSIKHFWKKFYKSWNFCFVLFICLGFYCIWQKWWHT